MLTVDDVLIWMYDEIVAWFQAGYRSLELAVCKLGRLPGRTTGVV